MEGSKALSLDALCNRLGLAFTRFDYFGHGSSDGDFIDGNIDHWLSDTLCVIDQLDTGRKHIIVGSSMGGWIATLAARQRPDRIAAMITIAAAPDFTETLLTGRLTGQQRTDLANGQTIMMRSGYDSAYYPISPQLIEKSRKHCVLSSVVDIDIPVRLMHGMSDSDVPYQCSIDLLQTLRSNDAQLLLIKNGDHRLSSPEHLELLEKTVLDLIE